MPRFRGSIVAAALLCVAVSVAPAAAQDRYVDGEIVKALQAGGHVLVMRHAEANPDQADVEPKNFKAIKRQQQLTDKGRGEARAFGASLREIGAKVGDVHTSLFHRALETAQLAGYKTAKPSIDLTEGSLVASPNEQRRRAQAFRQLIATPPAPGQTRVIVSHRVNIAQALGKEWYDVKEGEASLFRIENGAYALVARIKIDEWQRIAVQARN